MAIDNDRPDYDHLVDEYERELEENKKLRMTLRDQFAMAALTGVVSTLNVYGSGDSLPDELSELSYKYADAMLKQREKNDAD